MKACPLVALLLCMPLAACAPLRPPKDPEIMAPSVPTPVVPFDAMQIAQTHFGRTDYVSVVYSADSAFVLVLREPPLTPLRPLPATDFAIVERLRGHVTVHQTGVAGRVRWRDPRTVEVAYTSGTVHNGQAGRTVGLIDARTGDAVER